MGKKRVGIYVGEVLRHFLEDANGAAGSVSAQVNAIADRYAFILAEVDLDFSEDELNLILDCNAAAAFHPAEIALPRIIHNVEDGMAMNALHAKWSVDPDTILTKLRLLDRAGLAKLVQLLEKR